MAADTTGPPSNPPMLRGAPRGPDEGAFAGPKFTIPQPRDRTPSPLSKVSHQHDPETPSTRESNIDPAFVDVVYAEDEKIFREIAVHALVKHGFRREHIHEAEDGYGALEHITRLQEKGNRTMPLLVFLDIRMPRMDGRECARQIQELVKRRALCQEPFVIFVSSVHKQMVGGGGKDNYEVALPKPFNSTQLSEIMDLTRRWWTIGQGTHLSACKRFEPGELDVIAADAEPACRMASSTAFVHAGVREETVREADTEEDLLKVLSEALEGDSSRPLIVLLGNAAWAPQIQTLVDKRRGREARREAGREPFVVCTASDSKLIGASPAASHFHAFLSTDLRPAVIKWCLELCRLWWHTRGDGPSPEDLPTDSSSFASGGAAKPAAEAAGAD